MNSFELRITPRLVQQVAEIERFSGTWGRSLEARLRSNLPEIRSSMEVGAYWAAILDSSSPAELLFDIYRTTDGPIGTGTYGSSPEWPTALGSPTEHPAVAALVTAHQARFDRLTAEQLARCYLLITDRTPAESGSARPLAPFRTQPTHFLAPSRTISGDEIVFPTVAPFLIPQRMEELVDWVNAELTKATYHPLFIIGALHLLLLQLHPFPTANHRLAHVVTWHLLVTQGYPAVTHAHFTPFCAARYKQYFGALRQAEKSAGGSWHTMGIWLEFFFDCLLEAQNNLVRTLGELLSEEHLTGVQRRIVEVVRESGTATRDKIVQETGINLSTVKYNLSILSSRGHLRREGGGRTTSYRVC